MIFLEELPLHLAGIFSLRELFTSKLDLSAMPKRNLIRVLAQYASDEAEKLELMSLCSIKGKTSKNLDLTGP